jgi:hypothetical protein
MMAMLRIGGMSENSTVLTLSSGFGFFGAAQINKKGRKCELAAPAFDSERNYKCNRPLKDITTNAAAP